MSVRPRSIAFAVAVLTALAAAGCGAEEDRPLTAMEASRVVQRLDDVRHRTEAGDMRGARQALGQVRSDVDALAREGALTQAERQALASGLRRVSRSLDGRPSRPARKRPANTTNARTRPRDKDRVREAPVREGSARERGPASTPARDPDSDKDGYEREEDTDGDD